MATKRLYIAVGSTSINSLIVMIKRSMEENIYHNNNSFYLGLDSDEEKLKEFERLDTARGKLKGILIEGKDKDPTANLARKFQESWKNLTIRRSGVGGDSRLSFTTLRWQTDRTIAAMLGKLNEDDELILIGSAFGGTSTGLFWNVAQYLRKEITDIARTNNTKPARFYSIVILPEAPSGASRNKPYPLARNLCAFFKDTQMLEWGARMVKDGRSAFKMPVFPFFNDSKLQLWQPAAHGDAEYSALPMEHIFMVPTLRGKRDDVPDCVAEVALILGQLELWKKLPADLVNRDDFKKGTHREDNAFGGFNMLLAKNGKNALLRKHYNTILKNRLDIFLHGTSSKNDSSNATLSSWLDELKEGDKTVYSELENRIRSEVFTRKLDDLNNTIASELIEFKGKVDAAPYAWPVFAKYLKKIGNSINTNNIGQNQISMDAISSVYNSKIEEINKAATTERDVLEAITELIKKAIRIRDKRKNSFTVAMFGCKEVVQAEIEYSLESALNSLLDEYIKACRSNQTLPLLPTPISVDSELESERGARYKKMESFVDSRISASGSSSAGFIYEDTKAKINLDNIKLDGFDFNKVVMEAILQQSESEIEEVLEGYERKAISEMGDKASQLGGNNPFEAVKANFDLDLIKNGQTKPFHDAFRTKDNDDYHYAFYLQFGKADTLKWENLTDDMGFESFATYMGDSDNVNDIFKPEQINAKQFYFSQRDGTAEDGINGLWIGTLTIDDDIKGILSRIYAGDQLKKWSVEVAKDEEKFNGITPRLLSLNQFCYLGILLGAIQGKVNETCNKDNYYALTLEISVQNLDNNNETVKLSNLIVNDHFGCNNDDELEMSSLPYEWISPIMKWFDTSFEKDLGIDASTSLSGKLQKEKNILTSIQMGIPEDISKDLHKLAEDLGKWVNIKTAE